MSVTIGPHIFPVADYDAFGDIVYLREREGQGGISIGDTPEGHAFLVRADDGEEIVAVNLVDARLQLAQEGAVRITLPDGGTVEVEGARALITG